MNDVSTSAPRVTEQIILQRGRALVPALRERAAETESLRRLPESTNHAFAQAGFYKIMQPRRYGGYELEFGIQTELSYELAQGCGSSGWVAAIIACHGWLLGMFPEQAQDDVWGVDPDATIATSFLAEQPKVERVAGGVRLSGRWKFSSGVDHCDWGILLAPVPPADGTGRAVPTFVLVPLAACRVEDTWNTSGLAGTGSNDIVVADVLVAEHRMLDTMRLKGGPTPGSVVNAGYLYRLPLFGAFSFNLIGVMIGIARGVANAIVQSVHEQTSAGGVKLAASQSVQLRVAEALAEIDAAHALVFKNRDEIVRMAKADRIPELIDRARYRRDNGFAGSLCVRAVDRLMPLLGGRGLAADHPVQRAWRDIHAVAQHIALTWDVQGALHGATVLGQPCPDPRL